MKTAFVASLNYQLETIRAILHSRCYVAFFNRIIKFKFMIQYLNRYSGTDSPDNFGRWARLAVYKNIRIAWISRGKIKNTDVFIVSCHFPTMQNDSANEHKVCRSLEEAKNFVEERWKWFLEAVS